MPERKRLNKKLTKGGLYFDEPAKVPCISTGCTLLNCAMGGGWAEGRVGNIVGDKSTGKTLAMIEACANFVIMYPDPNQAFIRYAEGEAAFDKGYAEAIGLPLDRVEFNEDDVPLETVEDWESDLVHFMNKVEGIQKSKGKVKRLHKPAKAGLYILDSLDSIGDRDEQESAFGKDSYGAKKPKLIGQLFRRHVRRLRRLNITLLIVSQTRDKIGVMFGEKHTRSGGKALDFYASHIVWLSDMGKEKEVRGGVERKIGANIKAVVKKNKVGLAFREAEFLIRYAYGIDDIKSGLDWLDSVGMLDRVDLTKESAKKWVKHQFDLSDRDFFAMKDRVVEAVNKGWWEVERRFLPKRKKYG